MLYFRRINVIGLKGNRWMLIALLSHFCFMQVVAQDGHYWTQQYGTKSMLLSGSVIGGVEDLGAVFYNPGRIGLVENPAFLLSANVYEWTKLTVTDAFGESADLSKSDFGGVPSLVAGTFKLGFMPKHRFAYAILQRQSINADISYKDEVEGDVIEHFPGDEVFGASLRIFQKVREQWASLTWSYPFLDNLSFGITTNFMAFDQSKGSTIDLQALASTNQTAIYRYNRNFSFNKYGLLWKAGLAADFDKILVGLTVTTPVVNIHGTGNYEYEEFFSGIPGLSENEDIYTTSRQKNLPVTIRKPWAVGAGITFLVKKSRIHFSGEWYNRVPYYVLMQSETHDSQSSGKAIDFKLYDELESVVNFGIGLELHLTEKVSFYSSFSTDYSTSPAESTGFAAREPIAVNTVFKADYYHYGGGFILNLKGIDLTLGTTYTGGQQGFSRPVDFPEEGDDGIFEQDETGRLSWDRWRLVFSFSVPFLADRVEDLKKKTGTK